MTFTCRRSSVFAPWVTIFRPSSSPRNASRFDRTRSMRSMALARCPRPRSDVCVSPRRSRLSSARPLERRPGRLARSAYSPAPVCAAARGALPRVAPVHAHSGPGARHGRARRRPRPLRPHAATSPGRGRVREDGRRAPCAPSRWSRAGGRERSWRRRRPSRSSTSSPSTSCARRSGCASRSSTSSLRAKEHAIVRQLIASGDVQIVVGTHALIEKEVDFSDLAVAVVDEQHRFGVAQRTALVEGQSPHVLHLSATPIPLNTGADRVRRPRGERAHTSAGRPQAGHHGVGHRGSQLGGILAPVPAPR